MNPLLYKIWRSIKSYRPSKFEVVAIVLTAIGSAHWLIACADLLGLARVRVADWHHPPGDDADALTTAVDSFWLRSPVDLVFAINLKCLMT